MIKNQLQKLCMVLEDKKNSELSMIIGLDGFVDEIVHLVDRRQDFENFTRITTLTAFGERVTRAAGFSTNVEMVTVQLKLGGNGPILSNALLAYGVNLTYIGALGEPIHPVFQNMASNSEKIYSLCDPGHTHALEFEDGKLLMGKLTTLNKITWDKFKSVVGTPKQIAAMLNKCDLFGMENWTMIPYMSSIWQGMIDEVFPLMTKGGNKPLAFFDLADPEKRTIEDILAAMELIGKFETKFNTILGLNEKELYEIASVFGIKSDGLKNTTMETCKKLGLYCLVVHPVKEACCCINGQYYQTEGPYCKNPILTTGAGDNFNAGFCLGQALGLDPVTSLTLGVCTSGFYVRNAKSPTYNEVIDFAKKWMDAGTVLQ